MKEDSSWWTVRVGLHLPRSRQRALRQPDDGLEGIQAQTLSVFHHAIEANLTLLPVINKVDLAHASPAETSEQIATSFGLQKDTHMRISAKTGLGVDEVLKQIVDGLPPPRPWKIRDGKLRGLVFDTL